MVKPILVFGYGNLSRGDDALGPLLLDHVEKNIVLPNIELLTDFQLQIEHALDLENRQLVLFVDASVAGERAFAFTALKAEQDKSYTTHAMSPAAVLAVFQSIKPQLPPPCFLLSIKGASFELGEPLSEIAKQHLHQACQFVTDLLTHPDPDYWRQQSSKLMNSLAQHSSETYA
ncbi:MAG: hydrogenase maturation protease [Methylococcales bacterium]